MWNVGRLISLSDFRFFFSIVQVNGSLALLSKKVFLKFSNFKLFYPIIVFVVSAWITFIDPGGLTGYVVIPAIAMSIGYQMGFNPLLIGVIAIFSIQATIMTLFGVFGNIADTVLTENNYNGYQPLIIMNMSIIFIIVAILLFIVYKGCKLNENQNFYREQKLTLFNIHLTAGDVVLSGALSAAVSASPGEEFICKFSEGFGILTVKFTK